MTDAVGVALVGYGYWGANLARSVLATASLTLIGIADEDESRRVAAATACPGIQTWSSLDQALDDRRVGAVVLASPAATHAPLALRAIAAGRDVLVEKPLALDDEAANEVVAAAEAATCVVMVGHTFLYSSPVIRLRDIIRNGDLGNVKYAYSQRLSLGRIRSDCSALWNFGPHDVSVLLYLLDDLPVEVSGRGASFIQPGIDDVVFASLQLQSGIAANIHLSWIDPRKTRLTTVVGDQQMAVYDDVSVDRPLSLFDAGVARAENATLGEYNSLGDFQWRTRAGDIVIPRVNIVEPLLTEMKAFGDACQTRVAPVSNVRHGAQVVRILSAIDRSCRSGGAPETIAWP